MALLTKGQVRTAIAQAIDDPSNKRWSAPNLDILTTLVQDMMFEAILDSFEYLTSQTDLATPSGAGVVALSALSKRFYRVQRILRVSDSLEVQPKLFPESVPQPSYHVIGGTIETSPVITGASSLSVRYAYLPTQFTALANDATLLAIEYPEGHEAALIYLTAAWAMAKGDAESIGQIALIADQALEALLSHIARLYPIGANARVAQVKATLMRNMLAMPQTQGQG